MVMNRRLNVEFIPIYIGCWLHKLHGREFPRCTTLVEHLSPVYTWFIRLLSDDKEVVKHRGRQRRCCGAGWDSTSPVGRIITKQEKKVKTVSTERMSLPRVAAAPCCTKSRALTAPWRNRRLTSTCTFCLFTLRLRTLVPVCSIRIGNSISLLFKS